MTSSTISFESCLPVESHAREVMAWRNDPQSLASAFHRAPKVWEDFWPEYRDRYFASDGSPKPVFALENGKRVGFLRFRRIAHPQGLSGLIVDISINLAPEVRGRGLGTMILRAIRPHLTAQGVDSVIAEVRAENKTSHKTFVNAGYAELGPARKTVADTGEDCAIVRYVDELTPAFWRRGRVFVIAEAGSNWRMGTAKRDMAMAKALIDVAVEAGADAVKFQTYRPESVYVANAGHSDYLSDTGIKEDIRDIFADLAMPHGMVPELAAYCRTRGIAFMSTPFSPEDFAAIDPHVAVHKIASYEISHLRLLELAGRSGKPLVLSTGASVESDIAWAVDTFHANGGKDICLMQCTAKYPAPITSLNLSTIPWLKKRFGVAAGLSDHSREPALGPVMAVALGARVIEKHYTLDNRLPGPDHSFALIPDELKRLVAEVRLAEQALGDGVKRVLDAEQELAAYARRGLQATRPIKKGEILRENDNFAILRPGQRTLGAHPRHLDRIAGRKARRAIETGEGLKPDDAAD
ncbi:MAG: GNAT family N-acetyltransferase [Alphaproteobacteria bacterium]|nr:GNAT family N-acetyltransferase [Alphaproteobacteria bacterium]MBM3950861.1 GNAT family N-acetyltransferase [Rhodospirillales bacterium]